MSVCLELSSALSNSANSSTESTESTELTAKEEERDVLSSVVPSQNVAKLVLANSINSNNANTVLQKVSTSSVITVVNATGPLTILKSCGTSPSQFSLVNSAPLNVCNAICKPITVVGAPPITVVRAVSNLNQISKENGNNTADLVMSNSQSLNGISSDRLPIHNVFVKNTALSSSELITGLNEVQKLVPSGSSFVQSNVIQNVTSSGTKVANGQKPTCAAAGIVSNNKLKILNNIVVTSASPMSSTNTVSNNSNIVVNKSMAPKQYVQQKSINNSLNGTSKFNKNCSTINNNFSRGGARTVCSMPNQMQRLYPTHKSQIRTLPPVGNSGSKTGIKTLSPQFRGGVSSANQQVSKNASKLRSVHAQQRLSKMSNKPNYIGKHAIQAQKFKGSHLPGGRLKNNGKPSIVSSGGGSQRTPPNAGSVYHQVLTANIIQTLGENGGNSTQEYDEMPNYGQVGYNESARSIGFPDLTSSLSITNKPNYALDALSEVCKAILLDHNYNAAPPSESPVRNTLLATIQTQLNGTTPGSYYSPTNSNRSRVTLGTIMNTPSTLSSISNSSILQSNTGSSFLQDDDAASDISCGSERKMETEGEETDTAPEAEAVTQEGYNYNDHYGDYVTRCICGFLHDDGYMIECDKCKVWQHVRCVIKLNKKVPQDYLCDECDSSKTIDRVKARALQQQWMRENQERDAKIIRKETRMQDLKSKEALSDSDSSDGEQIGLKIGNNKNRMTTIARRKADQLQKHSFRHRRDSSRVDVHKRPIKRKDRKMTKKKTKVASKTPSDDDNNHPDGWQNTSISQIPQLRQWIENYEEAVTNHYSPELRARISSIRSNGVHSELLSQVDNSVHSCRVHTQPLTGLKYLVSTETLESNVPVIELRGKYMLSTQHRGGNSGNGHGNILSTRQHSQRPGPFLFFYRLHKDNTEVCVDTRTYGNDARFVRRSCTPNSELKHCIEKGVLHLYIVTISAVDKNMELTIKHESHDLAATGSTSIACACDKQEECALNKSSIKKNGDNTDGYSLALRKRRGRRTVSSTYDTQDTTIVTPKIKEEPLELQIQVKEEVNIKVDIDIQLDQIKVEEDIKEIIKEESATLSPVDNLIIKEEENVTRSDLCSPTPSLCTSNCVKKTPSKSDSEDKKESPSKELNTSAADKKKMSREERKIEAYMKAFERMERQQLKRQEHQAKQAHRRESEPGPNGKDEDKLELKGKRRKRKGRARTVSTNSQVRRNRLNSADSSYATSGEECLLSPIATESILSRTSTRDVNSEMSSTKNVDLLLTLSTNSNQTDVGSPVRDVDCNSNSANSSPETPLSSACLLVAAAVEPLERNFKFPKTKKILMNEWLNQSADCVQSASSISPSSLNPHFISPPENNFYEATSNGSFYGSSKIVQVNNSYCEAPSQAHGNAKKRWLRQAISEDRCDSPNTTRPDSPPISEMVAPPKKRRLPRETLSNDALPTNNIIVNSEDISIVAVSEESEKPLKEQEDRVEIVTAGADGDSPTSVLIDDAMLKERVAEMQQEIGACFRLPETREILSKESSLRCNLDPRLTRTMFNNSDHLVATVEKNLCILGFEDQKQDVTAPTKRKLSITEYRQRKKQTSDKETVDDSVNEENGTSRSPVPQKLRLRSDSVSSTASFVSSDEEEVGITELPTKTLSAFNSEPTELEKQRENVSLRLKKAFGLSVDDENRKTVSSIGALMNCELGTSRESLSILNSDRSSIDSKSPIQKIESDLHDPKNVERVASGTKDDEINLTPMEDVKPEMFYTPDEEDMDKEEELDKIKDTAEFDVECTNYVPPFNNPVYPNSSFTSFGSVIDDDVPYEGRNPSPPPELSNVTSSYSSP